RRLAVQNLPEPIRIGQNGKRRDAELVRVFILERLKSVARQVSATPHRRGQDHIDRQLLLEPRGRIQHSVEVAAEAASCNLLNSEPVTCEKVRINKIRRL